MRNACLDAALAELDAVGIRDYQLVRGGKHLQLRWTVAGHTLRMLTIPLTASDWRSPANTRSDLRKPPAPGWAAGDQRSLSPCEAKTGPVAAAARGPDPAAEPAQHSRTGCG